MKKLLVILFIAIGGITFAGEPTVTPSFEAFIELFKEVDLNQHQSLSASFFADSIRWERDDGSVEFISYENLKVALSKHGNPERILKGLASGFVFTGDQNSPSFVSIHNDLRFGELITVKPSALRLRKLPSTESATICILQEGIFAGEIIPNKASIKDQNGVTWVPVRLQHPEMGTITGYLAADFIEISDSGLPKGMKVSQVEGQWKITGFIQL